MTLAIGALLTACGGGSESSEPGPTISIENPTSAATYSTAWTGVRIGGSISNASRVRVRVGQTPSHDGYVFYNEGHGSWFAEISGLGFGENRITVTADADGTGTRTASAQITVIRPMQPVNLIFNGPNKDSASTFWTDQYSFATSHKIALFQDGTGRSTTASALSENAGTVTDFTWSMLAPDAIQVINCPTCSYQTISRISGSLNDATFYGQIETVGGVGQSTLTVFSLTDGKL